MASARSIQKPTEEQINIAVLWLNSNEGEERPACEAVAEWLEFVFEEAWLRRRAREAGIPVSALRREIAKRAAIVAKKSSA